MKSMMTYLDRSHTKVNPLIFPITKSLGPDPRYIDSQMVTGSIAIYQPNFN